MLVQCELCPKGCIIAPGQSGECRIRVNLDGKLVAVTYGYPCSVHVDPVEKKPVFHFLPGTGILSIATVGCNLHCKNCQNWEISQENPENVPGERLPPEELPKLAKQYGCRSVAYTYTEPTVYYEYTLDGCIATHEDGLKNVTVTAGYINRPPLEKLYRHVDGTNIDIKAMSEQFYRDICEGTLQPVLDACVACKALGVHVEITNLVIPTLNDTDNDLQKLSRWIAENMGRDTPLHFSAFHPDYRMRNLPPTPAATLDRAREIAKSEGLHYVYIGNVQRPDASNTYCPGCGALLIDRSGYRVIQTRLATGTRPDCKAAIAGVWQ